VDLSSDRGIYTLSPIILSSKVRMDVQDEEYYSV